MENPQLIDPAGGDFHIRSTSPCVDAGRVWAAGWLGGSLPVEVPAEPEDIDGDARPFDGTSEPLGDGSDFDIGADEWVGVFYRLTINRVGEGITDPAPGEHSYPVGTVVNISAQEAPPWRFDRWEGDFGTTFDPQITVTMDEDKTVTAIFFQGQVLVTDAVGNGDIDPAPGRHFYPTGSVVPLTATPGAGWVFTYWDGDLIGSDNPTTITMNTDKTVTAFFRPLGSYLLNIQVQYPAGVTTGVGTTSPSPGIYTYTEGEVVPIEAIVPTEYADEWAFHMWLGDVQDDGDDRPETAQVVMNTNKTVIAVFGHILKSLTMETTPATGGGVIEFSEPVYQDYSGDGWPRAWYYPDTEVQLFARPQVGWMFDRWEQDLTGSNNPATLLMSSDKTVRAVFVSSYQLTINVQGTGTTEPPPGTYPYGEGTEVSVKAIPGQGWRFDKWTGDVSGSTNPTTVEMTSDKSVTAVFVGETAPPPGEGPPGEEPGDGEVPPGEEPGPGGEEGPLLQCTAGPLNGSGTGMGNPGPFTAALLVCWVLARFLNTQRTRAQVCRTPLSRLP